MLSGIFRAPAALLFCLLAVGCSTHWEKPDGSSPLWDLERCDAQAEARYPVKNEVVYSTTYDALNSASCTREDVAKGRCRINYDGLSRVSCAKEDRKKGKCQPTVYFPSLESDIVDVNAQTRMAFTDACMKGRGWREVTHYFWR